MGRSHPQQVSKGISESDNAPPPSRNTHNHLHAQAHTDRVLWIKVWLFFFLSLNLNLHQEDNPLPHRRVLIFIWESWGATLQVCYQIGGSHANIYPLFPLSFPGVTVTACTCRFVARAVRGDLPSRSRSPPFFGFLPSSQTSSREERQEESSRKIHDAAK